MRSNDEPDLPDIIGFFFQMMEEDEPKPRPVAYKRRKARQELNPKDIPPHLLDDYVKSQIGLAKAETARIKFDLTESRKYAKEDDASADNARIYTFYDDVREASVKKCMAQLDVWARRDPGQEITVVFNSPGGSVFDGLALFDNIVRLRNEGTPVNTHALGMAASMGGILLQAGERRIMGRNAWLMIHEISAFNMGKASELEDEVKLIKRLQEHALAIFEERSHMTKQEIARKWKRKDWWLTAEEALELGFCDEVL